MTIVLLTRSKMLSIKCPIPDCTYETPESSEAVTCALLAAHSTIHVAVAAGPRASVIIKGPQLERPKVNRDARRVEHLQTSMGCVRVRLRSRRLVITTVPLRRRRIGQYPAQNGPIHSEQAYFRCHGRHEVASLHRSSHRCDASRARSHAARAWRVVPSIRSSSARKAETCAYIAKCICLREVDFTDSIIRAVLIAGIADLDIRREVLGTSAILERAGNDVISLVERKEIARDGLPSSASSISSFKRGRPASAAQPLPSDRSQTALCPDCKHTFALFSEGASGWNTRPHRRCIECYRGRRVRRSGASHRVDACPPSTSEMGTVFAQGS